MILGQLGHRVQHALRAYTPRDQRAVKTVAETMRPNPKLDIPRVIQELGVGEALVSFLDEKGRPTMTERVWMCTPGSRLGPVTESERAALIRNSLVAGVYDRTVNQRSATEMIGEARQKQEQVKAEEAARAQQEKSGGGLDEFLFGSQGPRGGHRDGLVQSVAKSVVRTQTRRVVNKGFEGLVKGIFGMFTKR